MNYNYIISDKNGDRTYFRDKVIHRIDGPAVEKKDGTKEWRYEGRLHNDHGPAIVKMNGDLMWYRHGVFHRENGPALISNAGKLKLYFFHGKMHRIGGPAFEGLDSSKNVYYLYGQRFDKNIYDIILNLNDRLSKGKSPPVSKNLEGKKNFQNIVNLLIMKGLIKEIRKSK